MQVIILAGGKGTRLQSVILDIPKPMAPIGERPFLYFSINELLKFNSTMITLATGYKSSLIEEYFKAGEIDNGSYNNIESNCKLNYSIESSPLGTGGAILKALEQSTEENILVVNGDTLCLANLGEFYLQHCKHNRDLSIIVKEIENFERYGSVCLEGDRVTAFKEKQPCQKGYINTGYYCINRKLFEKLSLQGAFSFETDVLEKLLVPTFVYKTEGYFIDIGIPSDYALAQEVLPNITSLPSIL